MPDKSTEERNMFALLEWFVRIQKNEICSHYLNGFCVCSGVLMMASACVYALVKKQSV